MKIIKLGNYHQDEFLFSEVHSEHGSTFFISSMADFVYLCYTEISFSKSIVCP